MHNPWDNAPRKPSPSYIVTQGVGNTWKILDYCVLNLAGGPGDEPEVYQDNIYDKSEADKIALRLSIEWWDELGRIYDDLERDRGDPKDHFKDETGFDPDGEF